MPLDFARSARRCPTSVAACAGARGLHVQDVFRVFSYVLRVCGRFVHGVFMVVLRSWNGQRLQPAQLLFATRYAHLFETFAFDDNMFRASHWTSLPRWCEFSFPLAIESIPNQSRLYMATMERDQPVARVSAINWSKINLLSQIKQNRTWDSSFK